MISQRQILVLAWAILCSLGSYGQSAKHWEKTGDQSKKSGDHYGAAYYYRKAIEADTASLRLNYKLAEAYRNFNNYTAAESSYLKVVEEDENQQFPEAHFWLALMEKNNGKFSEAKGHFKKYTKTQGVDRSAYIYKRARQEMKSCDFAQKLEEADKLVAVKNLGEGLNSNDAEFAPTLINDSTLSFSSQRFPDVKEGNRITGDPPNIRIYLAEKSEEGWKTTGELDSVINQWGIHIANSTFSQDGKRVYFSYCPPGEPCQIWYSRLQEDGWMEPGPVGGDINLEGYTSTQPHIAMAGSKEILYYASNRPKSKGHLDIWYSEVTKGGDKYSKSRNPGSKVNTKGNEITPFYDSKSGELYFSSDWHYGLGGFDIFRSKNEGRSYERPINLGRPYNSTANEMYFSLASSQKEGFITSNRKGGFASKGETCCNDIYRFELIEEKISDTTKTLPYKDLKELNRYLPVTMYFHNDEPNPRTRDTITTKNYLDTYKDYLKLQNKYRQEYSKGLKKAEAKAAEEDINEFFEDHVAKGVEDLEIFASLLIKELEQGQQIELVVKGYASPLAKSDYNVNLTLRRISSFINFLRAYKNGVYIPYLEGHAENGGSLTLRKIPYGEYKSAEDVSDNLQDKQNSVYSRKAGLERKIEILSVEHADQPAKAELHFKTLIQDIGKVNKGEKRVVKFDFTNPSSETLTITGSKTSCGCTVVELPKEPIPAGGKGEIIVRFDSSEVSGKDLKKIIIYANTNPPGSVIGFDVEVIEVEEK